MSVRPLRLNEHLQLGDGRTRIIVPLTASSTADLISQADLAVDAGADLLEWRIDLFDGHADTVLVVRCLQQLVTAIAPVPILATVRTTSEGGRARLDDDDYLNLIKAVADSGLARLLDVEHRHQMAAHAIAAIHRTGALVVGSHHDFNATPAVEVMQRWLAEQDRMGCDLCKIAVMAHSSSDLTKLLQATAQQAALCNRPLVTIAMGSSGIASRLIGGEVGSCATFASVGADSAPGQLPIARVRSVLEVLESTPR